MKKNTKKTVKYLYDRDLFIYFLNLFSYLYDREIEKKKRKLWSKKQKGKVKRKEFLVAIQKGKAKLAQQGMLHRNSLHQIFSHHLPQNCHNMLNLYLLNDFNI